MAISPIPHWFEGSEYTHKVAACIMKYGPISRITLAQILGLSQGAVSRITSDLIYAGVIEETPMAAGHGGKLPKDFLRKSAQKSIQKENTEIISDMGAVDIEGTPEVLTKLAIQVTTDMGDIDVSERLNGKVMENETDNLQTFEQKVEKATGSLTIETNSGDISVDCD